VIEGERKAGDFLARPHALRGVELHRQYDGTFLCVRWGLSRHLRTIDDCARFLRQLGATHV
jgi:hypothetical protein